jgi:hypothetical protein
MQKAAPSRAAAMPTVCFDESSAGSSNIVNPQLHLTYEQRAAWCEMMIGQHRFDFSALRENDSTTPNAIARISIPHPATPHNVHFCKLQ